MEVFNGQGNDTERYANKSMEEAVKADNSTDASDNADVKTETEETIKNPASESGQSVVYTPIDIRL